jgi:tetratricopeptide (TPR) repeat protein
VANYEGDYDSGTVAAQEALEAYTSIGDISGSTYARNALGIAALYTGDADLAEEHFTQALVVQRAAGDRRALGVALHNLGEVAAECRLDAARAERLYEESLALFESIGHTLNVASTLGALGELHDNLGNFELAITFATRAIDAYITVDNQYQACTLHAGERG